MLKIYSGTTFVNIGFHEMKIPVLITIPNHLCLILSMRFTLVPIIAHYFGRVCLQALAAVGKRLMHICVSLSTQATVFVHKKYQRSEIYCVNRGLFFSS